MNRKYGWIFLVFVLALAIGCASTPKRRSLGETLDDAVISNKLKAKFLNDKAIKGFAINIDTWKGIVSLRGKVDSQIQINRAIEVSELQPGVREVRSYLVLREQEKEGIVKRGHVEEKTIQPTEEVPPEKAPQVKDD